MKYRGILASSSDPSGQTLSKTVDGVVILLSAIVPMLALHFFHVQISAADISQLVTEGTALIASIMTIRGIILKIINTYGVAPQPVEPTV